MLRVMNITYSNLKNEQLCGEVLSAVTLNASFILNTYLYSVGQTVTSNMQTSNNSWSNFLFGDFVTKELAKKLDWRDLITARSVNKSWNTLFSSNEVWKSFYDDEYPFEAVEKDESYFNKFASLFTKFNGTFVLKSNLISSNQL